MSPIRAADPNDTFFEKLYIDDCEVVHDERKPLFAQIAEAEKVMTAVAANAGSDTAVSVDQIKNDKAVSPGLAGIFYANGSSKADPVELRGFEPQ